jgi:phosphate uptake regulator
MESRKVQRVGYSTLSVSLPSSWVKEVGIKQGDLVVFQPEKGGSLKLMPSALAEHRKEVKEFVVNADLCDEPGMLERIIIGNYVLGRGLLRVVSSERIRSAHVEEIRGILRRIIGLGIVEETSNEIVLQCSIDPTQFKMDMLLRRLSVITATMLDEATQALVDFNLQLARDVISREDEADTVYWLAMRLLLSAQLVRDIAEKIGLEDPLHICMYRCLLKHMELIADHTQDIATGLIELERYNGKVEKEAIEKLAHLGSLVHSLLQKAVDCVFTGDIKTANGIIEIRKVIAMENERLMRELPEIPHMRVIAWGLAGIADMVADIAAITINSALEKQSKICFSKSILVTK